MLTCSLTFIYLISIFKKTNKQTIIFISVDALDTPLTTAVASTTTRNLEIIFLKIVGGGRDGPTTKHGNLLKNWIPN
jgi:hypothetical protein